MEYLYIQTAVVLAKGSERGVWEIAGTFAYKDSRCVQLNVKEECERIHSIIPILRHTVVCSFPCSNKAFNMIFARSMVHTAMSTSSVNAAPPFSP